MNARDVIDRAFEAWFDVRNPHAGSRGIADVAIDALRRAAGGADRVVLAWAPTPCTVCSGTGWTEPVSPVAAWISGAVGAKPRCEACDGSGVGGYTVTLHTIAQQGSTCSCVVAPEQIDEPCAVVPLFRLVAVSPEPPKEPTDA